MIKKNVLFFVITFLVIQQISAITITLSKDSYYPGETLEAQITGNFESLKLSNVLIYKNDITHSNPVISDLTKQNDIYYFYALLPSEEGNYSIRIENSRYVNSGSVISEVITKNFSIKKTNQSYLSIKPGFIVTNKDFSIKVRSLNGDSQVNTLLESTNQSNSFSIYDQDEKTIYFSVDNLNLSSNLKINNYILPVFIIKSQNSSVPIIQNSNLVFIPQRLDGVINSNQDYLFNIVLRNTGDKNLTDVNISSDFISNVYPNLTNISSGNFITINVTIPASLNNLSGKIFANFDGKIIFLPISLNVTSNQSEVKINNTGTAGSSLSCSKKGIICNASQDCSGPQTPSLEGPCCIGQCIEQAQPTNYKFLIGIFLLIAIILLIAYFYFGFGKKKGIKSTEEMLKEKNDQFKKRMEGKEVHGGLGNI